ncbi:MAG: hypothetical protein JWQ42_3527 [Edaphobacter sp.]|nr:hypothetical protein [Edaphobacter sp.]
MLAAVKLLIHNCLPEKHTPSFHNAMGLMCNFLPSWENLSRKRGKKFPHSSIYNERSNLSWIISPHFPAILQSVGKLARYLALAIPMLREGYHKEVASSVKGQVSPEQRFVSFTKNYHAVIS